MGISYCAVLIAGAPYRALAEKLSPEALEALNEALDDGEVDYASPCFDSDREDWVVVVILERTSDYSYEELIEPAVTDEKEAEIAAFSQRYGVEAKLYLSLHGS